MTIGPEQKALALSQIRIDGGTQPRSSISESTVKDYAEYLKSGVVLPPPEVFYDGTEYWLADGFHRFFAAKVAERTCITVNVHPGTRRDAVLFSVGANQSHGLRRTHDDKRKAVMTLLDDHEWGKWSGNEIMRRVGVSGGSWIEFVSAERKRRDAHLSEKISEPEAPRTYTTKHGTEAQMNVANIGRNGSQKSVRKTHFKARVDAAAEGASVAITKRLPRKKDAEIVTRVMFSLEAVISSLESVDIVTLASDANADLWRDTAQRAISALRAFTKSLERKSA